MFFLSFICSSVPKGFLLFSVHYWAKSRTEMSEEKIHDPMEPLVSEFLSS